MTSDTVNEEGRKLIESVINQQHLSTDDHTDTDLIQSGKYDFIFSIKNLWNDF